MADLSTVTLPVLPLRNGVVFPHMVVTVAIESDEARRAIAAAETAQKDWAARTAKERANILRKWYELMVDNADDLGTILTAEQGKPFAESGADPSDLTDSQVTFLTDDNLRHILITSVESPEVAARWNNNVQALCESLGLGIPANNSSDPRHRPVADAEHSEPDRRRDRDLRPL